MSKTIKGTTPLADAVPPMPSEGGGGFALPPDVARVLDAVEEHLAQDHHAAAAEAVRRSGLRSPWLTNATAVCQLRNGQAASAIATLRGLATTDGRTLRRDVPGAFKVNLAAALLLAGDHVGFAAIRSQIRDEDHPSVPQYQEAYRRWRKTLTLGQRVRFALTGEIGVPFRPDFPPGELR